MRLPNSAHTSRPWRIREIARGFRLEDVWALPGVFGADDFPRLVRQFTSLDPSQSSSFAVRTLFLIRSKLGELFSWDGAGTGLGARVPALRDTLPADLRASRGPESDTLPFRTLYLTEDEWAAEVANRTVHGIIHVGRVASGTSGFHAQMAIYVKPNGLLGIGYMAAIRPFRYLIVYPAIMRELAWKSATSST